MIKKILLVLLTIALFACVFFWFAKKPAAIDVAPNQVISYQGSDLAKLQEKYGRVLVVYYSFTGGTREVATNLQKKTGADLYRLQLKSPYPATVLMYLTAYNQSKEGFLPELLTTDIDINDYDVIFVGSPVWWHTTPPPIRSFLDKTDFAGKAVVPFCTQGDNIGDYFGDFAKRAKNAKIKSKIDIEQPTKQNPVELDERLDKWLDLVAVQQI